MSTIATQATTETIHFLSKQACCTLRARLGFWSVSSTIEDEGRAGVGGSRVGCLVVSSRGVLKSAPAGTVSFFPSESGDVDCIGIEGATVGGVEGGSALDRPWRALKSTSADSWTFRMIKARIPTELRTKIPRMTFNRGFL